MAEVLCEGLLGLIRSTEATRAPTTARVFRRQAMVGPVAQELAVCESVDDVAAGLRHAQLKERHRRIDSVGVLAKLEVIPVPRDRILVAGVDVVVVVEETVVRNKEVDDGLVRNQ